MEVFEYWLEYDFKNIFVSIYVYRLSYIFLMYNHYNVVLLLSPVPPVSLTILHFQAWQRTWVKCTSCIIAICCNNKDDNI